MKSDVMSLRAFWRRTGAILLLALLVGGCREAAAPDRQSGRLRVTATTALVADLVKRVGGDRVEVQALMGPGVDPHLYKASASDVTRLTGADLIFYNGLLLEGKMEEVFATMKRNGKRVVAVTEALPPGQLLHPEGAAGHPDPHVWFDIPLWAQGVEAVVKALGDARPAERDYFAARGVEAKQALAALHDWALQRAQAVPKERRILITSHDAFSYFGRAYGFQVVALQGISTVTESSLADVTKLVDFIRQHQVPAIFVESSVPPATIRRISEDAKVKVGGELFSDAMGTPGQMENGHDLGTYEGMIRHNLDTIVNALK